MPAAMDFATWRAQLNDLVGGLTIRLLKPMLKSLGLSTTGNKPVLQERIMTYSNGLVANGDEYRIKAAIDLALGLSTGRIDPEHAPKLTSGRPPRMASNLTASSESLSHALERRSFGHPSHQSPQPVHDRSYARLPLHPRVLSFAPSPFFLLSSLLADPVVFHPPYPGGNTQVQRELTFQAPVDILENLNSGTKRVYLMCQNYANPAVRQPVYYPYNFFYKFKGDSYSPSTRGTKGVPGTAKPVDVTHQVLQRPGKTTLTLSFSVSNDPRKDEDTMHKAFAFGVYVVDLRPLKAIMAEIDQRPHFTSNAVVEYIKSEQDDEIETVERVHSLKDPVGLTRIALPVKSRKCTHIDCFDCLIFLQLQFQQPNWKCPICSKQIDFESLAVDDYFKDIIGKSETDVESVQVFPDGTWTVRDREQDDSEDDDDSIDRRPTKRLKQEIEVIDIDSESEEGGLDVLPTPSDQPTATKPVYTAAQATLSPTSTSTPSSKGSRPEEAPLPASATNEEVAENDELQAQLNEAFDQLDDLFEEAAGGDSNAPGTSQGRSLSPDGPSGRSAPPGLVESSSGSSSPSPEQGDDASRNWASSNGSNQPDSTAPPGKPVILRPFVTAEGFAKPRDYSRRLSFSNDPEIQSAVGADLFTTTITTPVPVSGSPAESNSAPDTVSDLAPPMSPGRAHATPGVPQSEAQSQPQMVNDPVSQSTSQRAVYSVIQPTLQTSLHPPGNAKPPWRSTINNLLSISDKGPRSALEKQALSSLPGKRPRSFLFTTSSAQDGAGTSSSRAPNITPNGFTGVHTNGATVLPGQTVASGLVRTVSGSSTPLGSSSTQTPASGTGAGTGAGLGAQIHPGPPTLSQLSDPQAGIETDPGADNSTPRSTQASIADNFIDLTGDD